MLKLLYILWRTSSSSSSMLILILLLVLLRLLLLLLRLFLMNYLSFIVFYILNCQFFHLFLHRLHMIVLSSRCNRNLLFFCFLLLLNIIVKFFLVDAVHGIFDVLNCSLRGDESFGTSFLVNLETINLWFIKVDLRWQYDSIWIMLQENMREARAEVSTINVDISEFRQIHFLASGAEHFEPCGFQCVT